MNNHIKIDKRSLEEQIICLRDSINDLGKSGADTTALIKTLDGLRVILWNSQKRNNLKKVS